MLTETVAEHVGRSELVVTQSPPYSFKCLRPCHAAMRQHADLGSLAAHGHTYKVLACVASVFWLAERCAKPSLHCDNCDFRVSVLGNKRENKFAKSTLRALKAHAHDICEGGVAAHVH